MYNTVYPSKFAIPDYPRLKLREEQGERGGGLEEEGWVGEELKRIPVTPKKIVQQADMRLIACFVSCHSR